MERSGWLLAAGTAAAAALGGWLLLRSSARSVKRSSEGAALLGAGAAGPEFDAATAHVAAHGDALGVGDKLKLYGWFKLAATGGPPTSEQPSLIDAAGRAKWQAWAAAAAEATAAGIAGGAAAAAWAAQQYVAAVDSLLPAWRAGGDAADSSAASQRPAHKPSGGPSAATGEGLYVLSRPLAPTDADLAKLGGDVHHCAAQGDAAALTALIAAASAQAGGGEAGAAAARALVNTDRDGERPLHFAADAGSAEALRCLLAAGAEVGAVEPASGQAAAHYAAAQGRLAALAALLDAGADAGAKDADGASAADLLEEAGAAEGEDAAQLPGLLARLRAAAGGS